MPKPDADSFAHGIHYGDYWGIVFYGPPVDGFWTDRLAISDCYIYPLFYAVLDRAWRGERRVPLVVAQWNEVTGWADAVGPQALTAIDAADLAAALAEVREADVSPHIAGWSAQECLRCAVVIAEFLRDHISRGLPTYVEDD